MRWYDWLANHSERRIEGIDIMPYTHCQICGKVLARITTPSSIPPQITMEGVCSAECLVALHLGTIVKKKL